MSRPVRPKTKYRTTRRRSQTQSHRRTNNRTHDGVLLHSTTGATEPCVGAQKSFGRDGREKPFSEAC